MGFLVIMWERSGSISREVPGWRATLVRGERKGREREGTEERRKMLT